MRFSRRASIGLTLLALAAAGMAAPPRSHSAKPKSVLLRGGDVMATVEGEPITRRELTYFWINTDPHAAQQVGALLAERWKADKGRSGAYTVSETAIYGALFGAGGKEQSAPYLTMLSNLVTGRLLAIEARRKGIVVTRAEAQAEAHRLLDLLRTQRGLHHTDEQILTEFHIPRDVFMDDMFFRLRADKLFAADLARRNRHPIDPNDWIVVRALFASAKADGAAPTEAGFAEARKRLESWIEEIKGGKSLADTAGEHNEDATRSAGGLYGPALRGTGTPAVETAIFALKPGTLSAPLRGHDGWYLFEVETKGKEIPEAARLETWRRLTETRRPQFLAALRRKAKITSITALPSTETPAATSTPQETPLGLEAPPAPPITGKHI